MILNLRSLISVAMLAPFLTNPALGTDICVALLAQGIRDTSSQQVTESRFNELRSNVCNSSYDSYSKAAQQAASGGLDVPGIFGISFGSANATTEIFHEVDKFLSGKLQSRDIKLGAENIFHHGRSSCVQFFRQLR